MRPLHDRRSHRLGAHRVVSPDGGVGVRAFKLPFFTRTHRATGWTLHGWSVAEGEGHVVAVERAEDGGAFGVETGA